jgi:hypothetical protein
VLLLEFLELENKIRRNEKTAKGKTPVQPPPPTREQKKAAARQNLKQALANLARSQWGDGMKHHATSSGEETVDES